MNCNWIFAIIGIVLIISFLDHWATDVYNLGLKPAYIPAPPQSGVFGNSEATYHAQYAQGTRSGNGKTLTYKADYNSGDGNNNKDPDAIRTEDSWQDVLKNNNEVSFNVKNDQKTTGNNIVHNFQIKTNSDDEVPAFGLGQKNGNWAIKTKDGKSVELTDSNGKPIPGTKQIDVDIKKTSSGKADVFVEGKKVGSDIKVGSDSILKTGIYTSDKEASVKKNQSLGVKFTNITTK